MDAAVGHVMEQAVLNAAQQLEDQLDRQIHAMENLDEDGVEKLRKVRIDELKRQQEKKEQWLQRGHGEYQHLTNEKDFFASMKGEGRMVCHFFRDNWPCKIIDKHLAVLCKRHIECKFVKIDAEKSPYLTEKLKIWMLPTLALIKNEKVVDYIVGLDDFGAREDFKTEVLEGCLAAKGLLTLNQGDRATAAGEQRTVRKGNCGQTRGPDDEDSDFD